MGRLDDKIAIVTGTARGNGEGAAMKSGIGCLMLIPPLYTFPWLQQKPSDAPHTSHRGCR